MHGRMWRWFANCVCLAAIGSSSAAAHEDRAMADGLERLAREIVRVIADEGSEVAVAVGDFVGPPRLRAAGGPGIARLLAAAIKARNVAVREKAFFQVHGNFRAAEGRAAAGDSFDSVALRIEAIVLDGSDRELGRIAINIFGDAALRFIGGTGDLPPIRTGEASREREHAKRQAIHSPRAALAGTEIRSTADSLFGIEVLVANRARPPNVEEGRAFLDLQRRETYVVRLHNRAPHDAAVTLTVDGLSIFAFSEEGDVGGKVLVPAGRFVDIPGWYLTEGTAARFEIADYPESAAASKLLPARGVGVITAMFHDVVAGTGKGFDLPSTNPKATKRGERILQGYAVVTDLVKPPINVVSVSYDR